MLSNRWEKNKHLVNGTAILTIGTNWTTVMMCYTRMDLFPIKNGPTDLQQNFSILVAIDECSSDVRHDA